MKSRLIPLLVANLFAATAAVAADGGFRLTGSVGIGLRSINTSGDDLAKLNEYRDLQDNGALSEIDVKGRGGSYYMNLFAENLGRDDQYFDLKGGSYGAFKYRIFDDRLRHNLAFDARTPYTGIGSGTLTAIGPFPNRNVGLWTRFDHGYKRDNFGGSLEWSGNSPWFIRADANEVTTKGVRPMGAAQGVSPGGGFVELATPVDYKTRNFTLEGGYSSKSAQFSLSWLQSKFSNSIDELRWQNGHMNTNVGNPAFAAGGIGQFDSNPLPPDNDLTKIGANMVLRQLPMNSTLAGRFTFTKLTNSLAVPGTYLNVNLYPGTPTAAGYFTGAPSSATFNGEHKYQTASLSLSSSPTRALDTRVYWNFVKKENNSTRIAYAPTTVSLAGLGWTIDAFGPHANALGYKKNNLGLDLGYRVNRQNKLTGGVDWTEYDRDRPDYDKSRDQKLYAQWKNSSLDSLSAKLKYQFTQRRSNFVEPFVSPTSTTSAAYNHWAVRRYEVSSFDQNLVKLVLDFNPVRLLDVGLEAIYKTNKYKDVILGREKDERQEFYANVAYGDPRGLRVSMFGDVEYIQYDNKHRYVGTQFCGTLNCDPAAPPTNVGGTAYSWNTRIRDKNYAVGVGADWPVSSRVMLKGSYIWAKTQGAVDFNAMAPTTFANYPTNIVNYDNTRRNSLNLRAVYQVDRNWEVTGGYAWERLRYTDDQSTGYLYFVPSSTTANTSNSSYLSGAYANPDYRANIVYLMAKYKF